MSLDAFATRPIPSPVFASSFKPGSTFVAHSIAVGDEGLPQGDSQKIELRVLVEAVGPAQALSGRVLAIENRRERSATYRGMADGSRIDFMERNVFV